MSRVVVYAGTRNIYKNMVTAAKSLLSHTRVDRVWFLIEDDVFPQELPDVIRCKNISGQDYFPPWGPNYDAHWTYTCLLPLAYPDIFREEDRVLRLDDDTIIMEDIGELFDMDMEDNYTAMVEEPVRGKFPFRYFNAGVCLMNLKKFRETGIWQKMIDMANSMAMACAVGYPCGLIGTILCVILLNAITGKKSSQKTDNSKDNAFVAEYQVSNPAIFGKSIKEIRQNADCQFVISRIWKNGKVIIPNSDTIIEENEHILVISAKNDADRITEIFGPQENVDWNKKDIDWNSIDSQLVSRKILVTKPELNGMRLSALQIRSSCGVTITRINRAGIDLVAAGNLELQLGDRVTVVGPELSVAQAEKRFGNSLKRLRHPNLIPIFIGVALGVILGSIPFHLPGIPQPVKLGLAGGPLIIAILIGRYGPHYKLVTYTTMSANLMLREIGITLFLACVGIGAGDGFVDTIVNKGGLQWIGYGFIITFLPLLIMGIIGRLFCKINYFTLMGLMAGSTTDPPALAYSNATAGNDAPAVGYATVYPLTMFLRVLTAQLLILIFC